MVTGPFLLLNPMKMAPWICVLWLALMKWLRRRDKWRGLRRACVASLHDHRVGDFVGDARVAHPARTARVPHAEDVRADEVVECLPVFQQCRHALSACEESFDQ